MAADRIEPNLTPERAERSRLKREYTALFEDLTAYLYREDPMRLNFEINPDEYEPEVGTIRTRILAAESAAEIAPVLREEFERWFGATGIENATYDEVAAGMLVILRRYRSS